MRHLTLSAGLLSGVAISAQVINFSVGEQAYKGDPLSATMWTWTGLFLCGPIIAAVSAGLIGAFAYKRSDSVFLFPRVFRGFVIRSVASLWCASAFPILLTYIYAYKEVAWVSPEDVVEIVVVTISGLLSVLFLVLVGVVTGYHFGRLLGVCYSTLSTLVIQICSYTEGFPLMVTQSASGSLSGLVLNRPFWLILLLVLVMLNAGMTLSLLGISLSRFSVPAVAVALVIAFIAPLNMHNVGPLTVAPAQLANHTCRTVEGVFSDPYGKQGEGSKVELCLLLEHEWLRMSAEKSLQNAYGQVWRNAQVPKKQIFLEVPPTVDYGDLAQLERERVAVFSVSSKQIDEGALDAVPTWLEEAHSMPYWCAILWRDQPPSDQFFDDVEVVKGAYSSMLQSRSTPVIEKDQINISLKRIYACEE